MKLHRAFSIRVIVQLLGAVIVLAVAAIIFLPTPERNTTGMKTLSPHHFALAIYANAQPDAEDHIRNLTIYPVDAAPDGRKLQYASGELFVPHAGGGAYEHFVLCAELPFHYKLTYFEPDPKTPAPGAVHLLRKYKEGRSATLTDFVSDLKYKGDFTFAWWASPRIVTGLWILVAVAGAGLIVIAAVKLWKLLAQRRMVVAVAPAMPTVSAAVEGPIAQEPHDPKKYEGEYYPVEHPDAKPH